jgi:Uncharacterised nucleotidyltransferase
MPESLARPQDAKSRPEVALLLACSRARLSTENFDQIREAVDRGIDWIALTRMGMHHDVMPLLYRSLQQACPNSVPRYVLKPLAMRYDVQTLQARSRAEELVRILAVLDKHGIAAVPYKGPVLAQKLFRDLSMREFGDLDIMISERDIQETRDLLLGLGYDSIALRDAPDFAKHVRVGRELQFYHPSRRTQVELHWHFANRLACIKQDPVRFLRQLEKVSLAGAQVPSLTLENYFLILSIHATKHRWRQLKLICDIAAILGQSGVDWNYVVSEARNLRIKRMLGVGAILAEDLLGAKIPPPLAAGLRIDRTARALVQEVRRGLFEEPDEHWQEQADLTFQLKIRERLRDKARMLSVHLPTRLAPDEHDRRFLQMPEFFSPLFFLTRPVRWAWERMQAR